MRFKEVEDIDLFVRNYQRNLDRIAMCDREIEKNEGEINTSSSIAKGSNEPRPMIDYRKRELFFRIDELMTRRAECERRVQAVHDLLSYLSTKHDKIWYDILVNLIQGKTYEDIATILNYSTKSVISIQYWKGLESYLLFIKS